MDSRNGRAERLLTELSEGLRRLRATCCPRCNSTDLRREPGVGPHFAQLKCNICNRHIKWLPKPKVQIPRTASAGNVVGQGPDSFRGNAMTLDLNAFNEVWKQAAIPSDNLPDGTYKVRVVNIEHAVTKTGDRPCIR